MSNTRIQIKRSSINIKPVDGSLSAAEPAYSYLSDKLFLGSSDGSGVIAIGGKFFVDQQNAVYNLVNSAFTTANAGGAGANAIYDILNVAFGVANSAYVSGNANYTVTNAAYTSVNAAYTVVNATYTSSNANYTLTNAAYTSVNAAFAVANAAYGNANNLAVSANAYAGFMANAANAYTNATYVKLTSPSQTVTGDFSITGNLFIGGNTTAVSANNLVVNDSLIYLANGNPSDILDIGFVGSYINTGSAHVHTGLFREHASKQYYLFQGYDANPELINDIVPYANNMVNATLIADFLTSNLTLGGANAIVWIKSAYDNANAGFNVVNAAYTSSNANYTLTNAAFGVVNAAYTSSNANYTVTNAAYTLANANFDVTNAAYTSVNAAYVVVNAAYTSINAGYTVANAAFGTANTADVHAANASYVNTGTLLVNYGGTGRNSFTANGVIFGNGTDGLLVTSAGSEGNVLQVNSSGVPQFGMLDGGNF